MSESITQEDVDAARAAAGGSLSACPFCAGHTKPADGRQLSVHFDPLLSATGDNTAWQIVCYSCGVRTLPAPTVAEAVQRWNRRARGPELTTVQCARPTSPEPKYRWMGEGPEPASWFASDGTKVYRSYGDMVDD